MTRGGAVPACVARCVTGVVEGWRLLLGAPHACSARLDMCRWPGLSWQDWPGLNEVLTDWHSAHGQGSCIQHTKL